MEHLRKPKYFIFNMTILQTIFVIVASFSTVYAVVPSIFDSNTVLQALQDSLPNANLDPTADFGGCTTGQVNAITQAWNDAMTMVQDAVNKLEEDVPAIQTKNM